MLIGAWSPRDFHDMLINILSSSVVQNIHVAYAGSYSASFAEADITFALTSQPDAIFLVVLFPTM